MASAYANSETLLFYMQANIEDPLFYVTNSEGPWLFYVYANREHP